MFILLAIAVVLFMFCFDSYVKGGGESLTVPAYLYIDRAAGKTFYAKPERGVTLTLGDKGTSNVTITHVADGKVSHVIEPARFVIYDDALVIFNDRGSMRIVIPQPRNVSSVFLEKTGEWKKHIKPGTLLPDDVKVTLDSGGYTKGEGTPLPADFAAKFIGLVEGSVYSYLEIRPRRRKVSPSKPLTMPPPPAGYRLTSPSRVPTAAAAAPPPSRVPAAATSPRRGRSDGWERQELTRTHSAPSMSGPSAELEGRRPTKGKPGIAPEASYFRELEAELKAIGKRIDDLGQPGADAGEAKAIAAHVDERVIPMIRELQTTDAAHTGEIKALTGRIGDLQRELKARPEGQVGNTEELRRQIEEVRKEAGRYKEKYRITPRPDLLQLNKKRYSANAIEILAGNIA